MTDVGGSPPNTSDGGPVRPRQAGETVVAEFRVLYRQYLDSSAMVEELDRADE